mgnify:CR=1 FL=1
MFELEKKHGRGTSKSSNSLREITISRPWLHIRDKKGGSDDYEFELIW